MADRPRGYGMTAEVKGKVMQMSFIRRSEPIYTLCPKKEATKLWAVTLSNLNRF